MNEPNKNQSCKPQDERRTKLLHACVTKLWTELSGRYGHRWISLYGRTWDGSTWLADLHDLTPDEFATGLRLDRDRGASFPPTSSQFHAMAISERRSTEPAHQLIEAPKPVKSDPAWADRWNAYMHVYGLRLPGSPQYTDEKCVEILEAVDVNEMHELVRREIETIASRKPNYAEPLAELAKRWPWKASQ